MRVKTIKPRDIGFAIGGCLAGAIFSGALAMFSGIPYAERAGFKAGVEKGIELERITHVNSRDLNLDGTNELVLHKTGINNGETFVRNEFPAEYDAQGACSVGFEGDYIPLKEAKAYEFSLLRERYGAEEADLIDKYRAFLPKK